MVRPSGAIIEDNTKVFMVIDYFDRGATHERGDVNGITSKVDLEAFCLEGI
jgi:hypothetical protein